VDDLERCSVAKALARLIIERVDDEGKRIIGDLREVGPLREVTAQQPVGVLVGPALPSAVRIGEEHPHPGGLFDLLKGGELLAVVPRVSVRRQCFGNAENCAILHAATLCARRSRILAAIR